MTPTALLVMDVQQGIVERFAGDEGYLPRLATAVRAARGAGIGIIYAWGGLMFTSQETPNLSTHMPNSSPQTCFCIGMVAVPLADSLSQ